MKLADRMEAGELVLEPLAERHRDDLRAACAEDPGIWTIYATPYGPEYFERSFDLLLSRPSWACFAIARAGHLIGMSCFIGIEPERGVLLADTNDIKAGDHLEVFEVEERARTL